MATIGQLIQKLDLKPHPEGGFYRETYRSTGAIRKDCLPEAYAGTRNYATCIYFLLTSNQFSAFHRIRQDEIWHFYDGAPVELHVIASNGNHNRYVVGRDVMNGQVPQLVVPGGSWFAAKVVEEPGYAFVGCTVSPGFSFEDFDLADRSELTRRFPWHEALIARFTHS